MNKALTAYIAIDKIVRDSGVRPFEEGVCACWKSELENLRPESPRGAKIFSDAVEHRDAGAVFRWMFSLVEVRQDEYDAVASLEFGITVPSPEGDSPDAYPAFKIEYRHSIGSWAARFDPWQGGIKEISAVVEMLGFDDSAEDFDPMTARTIAETSALTATAMIARHVKERYLE